MQKGDIVSLPDGYFDAFGRLRVSNPVSLFDYAAQYTTGSTFWDTALVGTGSETHVPAQSSVRLGVTAASDSAVRQTRQYIRYQPGRSQLVLMTGVLGARVSGVTRRIGYFDADNGIFLEQTGTDIYLVRRSKATGSVVEERVSRTDWNIEKIIFNEEKSIILVADLEWLGMGRIRMGLNIDGKTMYCHEFLNAGNLSTVWATTANLPLRYEISTTATLDAEATLLCTCATVISEGGFEESRGEPFAVKTNTAGVAVTTAVPLISIRPKATFNSIVNRSFILPTGIDTMARNKSAVFCVFYGATLTNASWTDVNTAVSAVEYDVSATAFTGGVCIGNIFVPASSSGVNRAPGAARISLTARLPLALTIAGDHPTTAAGHPFTDSLTVVGLTAETPDATTVYVDLQWQEIK